MIPILLRTFSFVKTKKRTKISKTDEASKINWHKKKRRETNKRATNMQSVPGMKRVTF